MSSQPVADPSLVSCQHYDQLQRLLDLAPGASARCDEELWRPREDSLNRTLALSIGAAMFYVVAESFDPRLIWDATNLSEVRNG
ncbi:MAG TPA: hypothetical protein VGY99_16695 [Candidatus Binataceae bacterium]|jgi:uncharacterized paraquat-inducible protein A|nr:hypothetical protein [Candidatus Binataceae bacterium]